MNGPPTSTNASVYCTGMNIFSQMLSARLLSKWWGNNTIKFIIFWLFNVWVHRYQVRFVIFLVLMFMLQSRNGPYTIFPLSVDNQSYFTPFNIIFSQFFPYHLFIHLVIILYECESLLFYSTHVIHRIHGSVYAFARHEFLARWNVITNGHPCKSSPKMSDISWHVLHDIWSPKGVMFAKFLS